METLQGATAGQIEDFVGYGLSERCQKTSPQLRGTASSIQRSPYMSLRADRYRQRAEDAKHRAAQAKDPSIKSAFEHVAAGWVALAEQVERIDTEKFPLREEENNHSVR